MENYWDCLPVEMQEEIYKFKHIAELKDVMDEMMNTIKHKFAQTKWDVYHKIEYQNYIVEYIIGWEYDMYYDLHIDFSKKLKTRPPRVMRVVYESKFPYEIKELTKYKNGLKKI